MSLNHQANPQTLAGYHWLVNMKNYNKGVSNKNVKTKLHSKFLKEAYTMQSFLFEAMQSR